MASADTDVASNSGGGGGPAVLFKKKRRTGASTSSSTASTSIAQQPSTASSSSSASTSVLLRRSANGEGGQDDGQDEESAASAVRPRHKKQRNLNARSALSASTGLARRLREQDVSDDDDDDDDDAGVDGDAGWTDRFGETLHETGTTGSVVGGKRKRGVDGLLEGLDEDAQRIDAIRGPESDEHALGGDGTYKGMKAYSSYLPTRDSGQSSKLSAAAAKGPIQGSQHIRTITLVDYQPDICKSYKETGYCGFGDTCKFLHDRSDYLAGWQLDSLPNSNARRGSDDEAEDDEEEEEEVPFACLICRKPFTDPIVTRCGHYFCSACAIKRFSKTSKCFACGAQTGGLFNSATKVLAKMERKRQGREEEKSKRRNKWLPAGEKPEEEIADGENGQDDLGIEGVEVQGAE